MNSRDSKGARELYSRGSNGSLSNRRHHRTSEPSGLIIDQHKRFNLVDPLMQSAIQNSLLGDNQIETLKRIVSNPHGTQRIDSETNRQNLNNEKLPPVINLPRKGPLTLARTSESGRLCPVLPHCSKQVIHPLHLAALHSSQRVSDPGFSPSPRGSVNDEDKYSTSRTRFQREDAVGI